MIVCEKDQESKSTRGRVGRQKQRTAKEKGHESFSQKSRRCRFVYGSGRMLAVRIASSREHTSRQVADKRNRLGVSTRADLRR